jgi:hypothetical protein
VGVYSSSKEWEGEKKRKTLMSERRVTPLVDRARVKGGKGLQHGGSKLYSSNIKITLTDNQLPDPNMVAKTESLMTCPDPSPPVRSQVAQPDTNRRRGQSRDVSKARRGR